SLQLLSANRLSSLEKCPKCDKRSMRFVTRLISTMSVQFQLREVISKEFDPRGYHAMDVSSDEVVQVMQEQYPDQFRVCFLTVVNRKQASLITELEKSNERNHSGEVGGNSIFDAVSRDRSARTED